MSTFIGYKVPDGPSGSTILYRLSQYIYIKTPVGNYGRATPFHTDIIVFFYNLCMITERLGIIRKCEVSETGR